MYVVALGGGAWLYSSLCSIATVAPSRILSAESSQQNVVSAPGGDALDFDIPVVFMKLFTICYY